MWTVAVMHAQTENARLPNLVVFYQNHADLTFDDCIVEFGR